MQNEIARIPKPGLVGQADLLFWPSLLAVAIGWFFLDTLHVSVGPIEHGVRFYDLAAIIGKPVRLFTGVDGSRGFGTFVFALLCCASLAAALSPFWRHERVALLGPTVPLALMLACALLLYARTSGEILTTTNDPAAITNDIFRFANDLIHRGGAIAARRVRIGAGGYLAFVGALALAVRAIGTWRKSTGPRGDEP